MPGLIRQIRSNQSVLNYLRTDSHFLERGIVGKSRQEIRVLVFLKPGGHFFTFELVDQVGGVVAAFQEGFHLDENILAQ